jgi:hypothetical protein
MLTACRISSMKCVTYKRATALMRFIMSVCFCMDNVIWAHPQNSILLDSISKMRHFKPLQRWHYCVSKIKKAINSILHWVRRYFNPKYNKARFIFWAFLHLRLGTHIKEYFQSSKMLIQYFLLICSFIKKSIN